MMDVADFQDLLDRLGDDLSTWPDQSRHDAESLLRGSEAARTALAEAQGLRQILSPQPVTAPPGLIDRIMQRVRTDAADRPPSPTSAADSKRGRDPEQS
jgi:hypothetical protein